MKKKSTSYTKILKQYAGLILILLGTMTLAATRIATLDSNFAYHTHTFMCENWMLLTGLLLIMAGIVVHTRSIKHESRY